MGDIDNLVQQQLQAVVHMKILTENLNKKPSSEKTKGFLASFLQEIENLFDKFKKVHDKVIIKVNASKMNINEIPYFKENVYYEFFDQFICCKANLVDAMPHDSISSPMLTSTFALPPTRSEVSSNSHASLPKITLPKFSGDYMEWIPFRDIYLSLVHNNFSISKIQKFYYLKGSLLGEAATLVKAISVTEANYETAWTILENRYHNKRVIVDALLKKMFNVPESNGTAKAIRQILDTFQESLQSLRNLEIDISSWDAVLVFQISQKLDSQSRKEWEQFLKSSTEIPSINDMFSFLENTFRALESVGSFPKAVARSFKPQNQKFKKNTYNSNSVVQSNCLLCEKPHALYRCFKFLGLPHKSKVEFLSNKNICFNCLNLGHQTKDCKSSFRCNTCKKHHHSILHAQEPVAVTTIDVNSSNSILQTECLTPNSSNEVSTLSTKTFSNVLLSTIRLVVKSASSQITLRALLDQGSQATLITENAAQLLKLKKQKIYCDVSGVGENNKNSCRALVHLNLWSAQDKPVLQCKALVLSSLTTYTPKSSAFKFNFDICGVDTLADPLYYNSDPIDIILGADVFTSIALPGQSKTFRQVFLQNTYFGWVISGPVDPFTGSTLTVNNLVIENLLRSFWEQEEISNVRELSEEEKACELYFRQTTKRHHSGKYIVNLPFKSIIFNIGPPVLNNNQNNAFKRLQNLEKCFLKRPQFFELYKSFIHEYEQLGHMSKIGIFPSDIQQNTFYLPHHGIFKESSTTTKLRVVFDGSSKSFNSSSLNDELSSGPPLQNDLPQVICRWRKHKIAFTSDIEKMFRQILVADEHQCYQQILWRDSPTDPISIYRLNTVTYGTTPAPFLSIRVLQQLAEDYKSEYPNASKILITDSYVDDIISGSDTPSEAILLQKNLCSLLSKGQLSLRKWISNCPEFIEQIPEDLREKSVTFDLDADNTVKALGVQWNTVHDSFTFKVNFSESDKISKRTILSDVARLFDPLGWLTPSTVIAKIIYQRLWLAGLDWDSEVPQDIVSDWKNYRSILPIFEKIKIPRHIGYKSDLQVELHCFADASQVAYAAVAYSRIKYSDNHIIVNLLQAKSKVAPVKTVTIPRLELCAATLLVKLANIVKNALGINIISSCTYWSDSSTVLSWIRKPPARWSVYVANRVGEIQRFSNISQWRYVPSAENPADCASRGVMPNDLIGFNLWWKGPHFLTLDHSLWPSNITTFETNLEEKRTKITSHNITESLDENILARFSNLTRMLRVLSFCRRFCKNCKTEKQNREIESLSSQDINSTLNKLIKISQNADFHKEISLLQAGEQIKNKTLSKLMPFVDINGILRVGGRLQNSNFSNDLKHPIFLSKSSPLSKLIILDAHHRTRTLSYVSRRYWILSSVQLAKKVVGSCLTCYKYRARTSQQIMGNLPNVRLNITRPFKHSGVDYAGPILIKNNNLRTSAASKGYICLFVCMVTKAIHLELVSDLTTNAFLAAFRRFVSRRGFCSDLYSDCGTNFVGAAKELQILFSKSETLHGSLCDSLANQGTNWHFIPPASPNFGGLWEAGVKSVKRHLRRVVGEKMLNFEELATLLCQIESCLNSRPLCPLSSDPRDVDALTPGHFLIGEPTNCIPDDSLLDTNINHITRWKAIEKMKQHFWKRWRSEYLNRLQARPKWLSVKTNPKIGELVLVADERCGPGQWLLGRIHQIHPGADGHVRVVSIYTKNKIIKRPITKICFLPSDSNTIAADNQNSSDDLNGAYLLGCESERSSA